MGRHMAFLAVAALVFAASGTAGAPITKAQYQGMLEKANARVSKTEGAAERGLNAHKSSAQMKTLILAWAATETSLGRSFKAIVPPTAATKANALLARGEIQFGSELATAANHLPAKSSAIGAYLNGFFGKATGPGIIDKALALLKKAGYTTSN